MAASELFGISQVQETGYIDEVNANLEKGWKLILAYTYAPSSEFPNDLTSMYSLGWPSELGDAPDFIQFKHSYWADAPDL